MSIYADTQTPSHAASLVNAFTGFVVARARQFVQIVKNRHDANVLAGLDDRMLADIGLTRGDLRDAISEPVWRDPTAILVSRAQERRHYRRSAFALSNRAYDAPSIVPKGEPASRISAPYY